MKPTKHLYGALQAAFDHFNRRLFSGDLPEVLITLARKRNTHGYFFGRSWREGRDADTETRDEIALNPESLQRPQEEVLSTLVHEMVHHWQQHFGKPGKDAYHNRQWAEKMTEIGLPPVSANGKGTGKRVSHNIDPYGLFSQAADQLPDLGLQWWSPPQYRAKQPPSRIKYECPNGCQSVWGTQSNHLICGLCQEPLETEDER